MTEAILAGASVGEELEEPSPVDGFLPAPDEVEELATAVSRPGGNALLITPDNQSGGWTSIREAARSGRSFAVDVAPTVLAVDQDDPDAWPDLERLKQHLEELGIEPVVVASGRPGHHHLFARLGAEESVSELARRAKELSLDVRRTIRPPLSPHRLGYPTALLSPGTVRAAVAALRPRRPWAPQGKWGSLLRHGDVWGRYPHASEGRTDRSRVIQALAQAAVNDNVSCGELFAALIAPENAAGEKVREIARRRGLAAAWSYVERSYRKAAGRPAVRELAERVRGLVAASRSAAEARPERWRGTGGATDWQVLQVLHEIALESGRATFDASVRLVAERAGIHRSTASKAIRRLVRSGWLVEAGRNDRYRTKRYGLAVVARDTGETNIPHTPPYEDAMYVSDLTRDVWRWGGLGLSAKRIWEQLNEVPVSTVDLAERCGLSRRSVQRHLKALSRWGLALRDRDGWVRGPVGPEDIAHLLPTEGLSERQRQDHRVERIRYLWPGGFPRTTR